MAWNTDEFRRVRRYDLRRDLHLYLFLFHRH
jgi:hypothetical protein